MIDRTPAEKVDAIIADPEGYFSQVRAERATEAHLFVAEQMSRVPHRKPRWWQRFLRRGRSG